MRGRCVLWCLGFVVVVLVVVVVVLVLVLVVVLVVPHAKLAAN